MFHYFSIQQNAYQLQKIQGCFEAQLPKFNQCCVTNAISIVYQKPDPTAFSSDCNQSDNQFKSHQPRNTDVNKIQQKVKKNCS